MKKNKRHLEFYKKYIEYGYLPEWGLCECAEKKLISSKLLTIFVPSNEELEELMKEGKSYYYWASYVDVKGVNSFDYDKNIIDRCITFTPLRQTIVLFMAALNNEL